MRLTYTDILAQHLRNVNLVGSTDADVIADFQYNLGQRYQLALARLVNYKTTLEYSFTVGMQSTLLSSGTAKTISSITSSTTTATVTTSGAHGYTTSNIVAISGAYPSAYNGTYTITVTSTTTFTYTLPAAQTVTTALTSQFYPLPLGEITVEGMYITVGSVNYPLQIINSRLNWEKLNSIMIQASALPQFYFPRQYDFGIWPTPQTVYTGNISYHYHDRNLSVPDVTDGTVTVKYGSTRVIGTNSVFTPAMVGRWFTVTSTSVPGQGYFMRVVSYTDANNIDLNQPWANTTATGANYRIGESPEMPEELHSILAWGTASDYYAGMQKDPQSAGMFDNLFWTGSPTNSNRTQGDATLTGGLLGGIKAYANRDNRRVIKRKPKLNPLQTKVFATTLS